MPIITVQMFGGRTDDQKEQLAKEFTDTLVEVCGLKPEGVQVIYADLKPHDYAVGGKLFARSTPAPAVPEKQSA